LRQVRPKECSFTNKYKNKTLRQDIVSLKQTKNFKRFIDAYPLVGTGGGGKIKKQNYYKQKQNCIFRQKVHFIQKINFAL